MVQDLENKKILCARAAEIGLDLLGVADIVPLRGEFYLDRKICDKFHRALSLGQRLLGAVLDEIQGSPTPLYFHHYRQINAFLDRAALSLAGHIQNKGYRALPVAASQIVDWGRQRAHLSHKRVGQLAGLGWLGRNNLLVHPDFGAQIRLATILTDMPLRPDMPLEADCGACSACLASCPAMAIKDNREDFDHIACFEKLKEFRRSGVVGQYICGVCVKACPGKTGSK